MKFTDDTKVGGFFSITDLIIIQGKMDDLEDWDNINRMKFNSMDMVMLLASKHFYHKLTAQE